MSEEKKTPEELKAERIAKDMKALDKMKENDHVEATIVETKFRGVQLQTHVRENIKNKKKEGRVKLVPIPWKKGERIIHSLSQIRGWVHHGVVTDPKVTRKRKD